MFWTLQNQTACTDIEKERCLPSGLVQSFPARTRKTTPLPSPIKDFQTHSINSIWKFNTPIAPRSGSPVPILIISTPTSHSPQNLTAAPHCSNQGHPDAIPTGLLHHITSDWPFPTSSPIPIPFPPFTPSLPRPPTPQHGDQILNTHIPSSPSSLSSHSSPPTPQPLRPSAITTPSPQAPIPTDPFPFPSLPPNNTHHHT